MIEYVMACGTISGGALRIESSMISGEVFRIRVAGAVLVDRTQVRIDAGQLPNLGRHFSMCGTGLSKRKAKLRQ
ncbi:hypothetical protein [Hoeflea sp. IMCC20628]|uniref:hypothetical protein n=1 Tax=Hoeflea sp. IMCC20628 TaxID=1620421 RepID=UPI0012E05655|nr:hypothetical protein [Hoeflea sp. IMCC20628]